MAGFRRARVRADGVYFVFDNKSIGVSSEQIDIRRFEDDRDYREGLISLFSGLMLL